jgi:hypothetical protein
MKVSPAAQLAAAETELSRLKLDDWRREAEKLIAAKLREVDERHVAPPERRLWWHRLAGG